MQIEIEPNCPLDSFNPCRKTACAWFTQVRGTNPNTGQEIDEYGCAIAWLPLMLIENSKQSMHTSAAVESFRNEVVKNQKESLEELGKQFERPIIESK